MPADIVVGDIGFYKLNSRCVILKKLNGKEYTLVSSYNILVNEYTIKTLRKSLAEIPINFGLFLTPSEWGCRNPPLCPHNNVVLFKSLAKCKNEKRLS